MKKRTMVLFLVILLVVGFASVSTSLFLNGIIGISSDESDFNIIFTSAKLNNQKRNDFIDETKKVINFETNKLSTVDEEAILDYEVTNTSRLYDGEVVISCEVPDNEYVNIQYEPKSMSIEAGKTKSGRITARLIKASVEDQSISIKCTLNANAIERDTLGGEYVLREGGTLMAANYDEETGDTVGAFWDYKNAITKVVFEDELNPHETSEDLIFDVSENQDKSVMAYLVGLSEEEQQEQLENLIQSESGMTLDEFKKYYMEQEGISEEEFDSLLEELQNEIFSYELYIQANGPIYANENSSRLFENFYRASSIENLNLLDTSNVTNMSRMFSGQYDAGYSLLTSLDLSNFDTSNVTDMSRMFSACASLKNLDLSNFDTSSVTDMSYMFLHCSGLTNLDLSNFDTSNVINMSDIFSECTNIQNLNLSNFNTTNVTDMSGMFFSCHSLISLDLSSFNTTNVTSMGGMFSYCDSLISLDLSNFNTINVTNMYQMFICASSLNIIDLSNFNFGSTKNMVGMFASCDSNAIVKVKDEVAQKKILDLYFLDRPSAWTTDNIIIAS